MLSHINVGSGVELTIQNLAEILREVVGFKGQIIFDETKPDGTPRKLLDISLLLDLGWSAKITLEQGLRYSYSDFLKEKTLGNLINS